VSTTTTTIRVTGLTRAVQVVRKQPDKPRFDQHPLFHSIELSVRDAFDNPVDCELELQIAPAPDTNIRSLPVLTNPSPPRCASSIYLSLHPPPLLSPSTC
jgi:hypothetical protein